MPEDAELPDAFDVSQLPCGICGAPSVDVVKFYAMPGRGGARCRADRFVPLPVVPDAP